MNVKSYKINKENDDKKKVTYGKCYEREKNNEKIKDKAIIKKKINIYTDNNNSGMTVNNSNTFLQHVKNINTPNNLNNPVLSCYFSPKTNSQVFNNFYSINCGGSINMPVKIVNFYNK